MRRSMRRKKTPAIGIRCKLGAALAVAVGIVAAKPVCFTIARDRADILVALVAGHDDGGTYAVRSADALKQMHGTHHVGRIGQHGLIIGHAYERLRRQMNDDFGFGHLQAGHEMVEFADVSDLMVLDQGTDIGCLEEIIFTVCGLRKSTNPGTEPMQQNREPGSLESGMTGEKDTTSLPELRIDHQSFHFAVCWAHSAPRKVRSRNVSIGCQKPRCP